VTLTDRDLKEIIEAFVDVVNNDDCLQEVLDTYRGDQSLGIHITGSNLKTGIIASGGRLRVLTTLDHPTIMISMGGAIFWDIINSKTGNLARVKVYRGIFTDQDITVEPPPGIESGMLHIENLVAVFTRFAKVVMG